MARNDLVQLGEIEIGSWRYRYGSHFSGQLRLSPKQFVEKQYEFDYRNNKQQNSQKRNEAGSLLPGLI
jgi:hypothetical protein